MSSLLRRSFLVLSRRAPNHNLRLQRNSHGDYWGYREPNYDPKEYIGNIMAKVFGGFLWWWLIYHFYHEPERVYGHFPYHNPEVEWSDEELGIPPDEDGLAPTIPNPRSTRIPECNLRHRNFSPHWLEWRFGDTGIFKF